jgi:hypothetical protein
VLSLRKLLILRMGRVGKIGRIAYHRYKYRYNFRPACREMTVPGFFIIFNFPADLSDFQHKLDNLKTRIDALHGNLVRLRPHAKNPLHLHDALPICRVRIRAFASTARYSSQQAAQMWCSCFCKLVSVVSAATSYCAARPHKAVDLALMCHSVVGRFD